MTDEPPFDSIRDVLAAAVQWQVRGDDPSAVALMAAVRRYRDDVEAARKWTVPGA